MVATTGPDSYRLRHYRWFYRVRNLTVALIYPMFTALAISIALSPYVPTAERVLVVVVAVASLGVGLTGFFMNVGLRRQADQSISSRERAVIFRSAYQVQLGAETGRTLDKGWYWIDRGHLVVTPAQADGSAGSIVIPLDSVRRIERRVMADGHGYPRLAVVSADSEIIFELPAQSGHTFRGISDREFRDVIDALRRDVRADERVD